MKGPSFSIKGSETAAFCKHHDKDTMVNGERPQEALLARLFYEAPVLHHQGHPDGDVLQAECSEWHGRPMQAGLFT